MARCRDDKLRDFARACENVGETDPWKWQALIMYGDWRDDLAKTYGKKRLAALNQSTAEIEAEYQVRWEHLDRDQQFLIATHKVKASLADLYKREPDAVKFFFWAWGFGIPSFGRLADVHRFIQHLPKKLRKYARRAFMGYAKYVDRFRVYFKFRVKDSKPTFKPVLLATEGFRFSGRLCDQPPLIGRKRMSSARKMEWIEWDSAPSEDSHSDLPDEVNNLIESKAIKFIELRDELKKSTLTRLETDGYHLNGVTLVVHQTLHPRLWCLVGEDITDPQWRKVYKAVSALLRRHYGRSRPGRKRDPRRVKKGIELRDAPGSKKSKAAQLDEETRSTLSASELTQFQSAPNRRKLESDETFLRRLNAKIDESTP